MNKIFQLIAFASVLLFFNSCEPAQEDAIELSAVPSNVSFSVAEKAGEVNTYILTNTTSGTFLHQWDLGNGTTVTGDEVEVYYPLKGDYEITLRAFNNGGFGESKGTVNVLEDDSAPCTPNSLAEFLTDCEERTWTLLQDAGAYWVGPDPDNTWWSSPAEAVTERFCAFDDEWTFMVTGEMIYDTQGDLWAEDYMGYDFECVTDDQLAENVAPWASGEHIFVGIEGGDVEQIQLIGLGAFMGLPKAANGAEVTEPVASITYDIVDRSEDADGKYMELEVNYNIGIWRFKFVSPN